MQDFPHQYQVSCRATPAGPLDNTSEEGLQLATAPPKQFGGEGTLWSPEHLLTAALSSCLVLTFRAVATASQLAWQEIGCQVDSTLDRIDRVMLFTHFAVTVQVVAAKADESKIRAAVEKAKANCLVSNSLNATIALDIAVVDTL